MTVVPVGRRHNVYSDDDDDDDDRPNVPPYLVEIPECEIPTYFEERDSRLFPSHGGPYPLPVDGPELGRLNQQHRLLKLLIHGNYVGPAEEILGANPQSRVLDLCTGTGLWVVDMAVEFPHVEFTGFDIVPIHTRYPPPNVIFEMQDVTLRSRFRAGSVDLVHARDAACMTADHYVLMLTEAARVLRTGGLILLCEWALRPISSTPAASSFHDALAICLRRARGITDFIKEIPSFLLETNNFSAVQVECHLVNIGDSNPNSLGSYFRRNYRIWISSMKSVLIEGGNSSLEADRLIRNYKNELRTGQGVTVPFYTFWAYRL